MYSFFFFSEQINQHRLQRNDRRDDTTDRDSGSRERTNDGEATLHGNNDVVVQEGYNGNGTNRTDDTMLGNTVGGYDDQRREEVSGGRNSTATNHSMDTRCLSYFEYGIL